MERGDEAWMSIISAGRDHLVKMPITLGRHGIILSNLACLKISHCLDTGMQNDDDAGQLDKKNYNS